MNAHGSGWTNRREGEGAAQEAVTDVTAINKHIDK